MRQPAREAARRGRGIARADHRHHPPVEQLGLPACDQQRRRIVKLRQRTRIQSLTQRQITRAELLDGRHLALRLLAAA
ncbi:hypothetical protein GCM10023325_16670 [Sphingomonas lutea]